ncbi:uncharacterized protein A4U43_C09F6660 [Asparagus officinalis]|uniref:Small ribosomal subunit protein uS5 C-terminal domain-containing protein n=1 Tax=Asparagus officinalis TaxID=4686 RepID=A0A5P1E606_ASPOF|nr:uncharacterized protein A4U43_C09F6660 [Asparagus officinalis]
MVVILNLCVGIVAARVPKKVLQFAGIDDVFTSSRGSTKTLRNFVKVWSLTCFHSSLIFWLLLTMEHNPLLVVKDDEKEGEEGEEEGLSKYIGKELKKLLQCHSHCK